MERGRDRACVNGQYIPNTPGSVPGEGWRAENQHLAFLGSCPPGLLLGQRVVSVIYRVLSVCEAPCHALDRPLSTHPVVGMPSFTLQGGLNCDYDTFQLSDLGLVSSPL